MVQVEPFAIRIGERLTWDDGLVAEDPLGELTDLQLRLSQFCAEQNRLVSFVMGESVANVLLFPDVCMIIESLPEQIRRFSDTGHLDLLFPESGFNLSFRPAGPALDCILFRFGTNVQEQHVAVSPAEVRQAFSDFLDEFAALAVESNYLSQQEANSLMIGA